MRFLSETLISTQRAVEERRRLRSLDAIRADLSPRSDDRVFLNALRSPGVSVIAEFKRRWPSAKEGDQPHDPDLRQIVGDYQRAGARAVSVLTENEKFGGSHADLRLARQVCDLPILDKDFIIDEYQVYEAVDAGADAILLIGEALSDAGRFGYLYTLARELHLDVLVEVRSEGELDRALDVGADLVGINNRDLKTLRIDPEVTRQIVAHIPTDADIAVVSESGLKSSDELNGLDERVDAVLIGAALMTAPDRYAACSEFVRVGAQKDADRPHPALA
jgi:indole-3-glycerol phosphate synthase